MYFIFPNHVVYHTLLALYATSLPDSTKLEVGFGTLFSLSTKNIHTRIISEKLKILRENRTFTLILVLQTI